VASKIDKGEWIWENILQGMQPKDKKTPQKMLKPLTNDMVFKSTWFWRRALPAFLFLFWFLLLIWNYILIHD